MADNVDELKIEIESDAKSAASSIDSLCKKLQKLSQQLTGFSNNGAVNSMHQVSDSFKTLATSVDKLDSTKLKDANNSFRNMANSLKKLTTSMGGLSNINGFNELSKGLQSFSNVNIPDMSNLPTITKSLKDLSGVDLSSLNNTDLSSFSNSILQMSNALKDAPKIEGSVIALMNATAKLGATGNTIGAVTTELPLLGNAIRKLISDFSGVGVINSDVIQLTDALGKLASAGNKTEKTAQNLEQLGVALRNTMQNLASAPMVSGNLINMTNALANLASAGNRTGIASNTLSARITSIGKSSNNQIPILKRLTNAIHGLGSSLKSNSSHGLGLALSLGKLEIIYHSLSSAFGKFKGSLDLASDLVEVQNVVNTAFGNMSNKMEEFAKNSVTQFGISELTAKQTGSTLMAMASGMGIAAGKASDMAISLTGLSADMSSFYNVSQDVARTALQSIFTGETETLKRFGIVMTEVNLQQYAYAEGIKKKISAMTQAEKVQLRYNYVMSQTALAQGDFAKTADSYANQVRILSENFKQLGTILGGIGINAFKPLIAALNTVMGKLIAFAQVVSESLGKIFGWKYEVGGSGGGGIADLGSDLSDAAGGAGNLADNTGKAAKKAKELKQQLSGIDKLNVITSSNNDSSSGGKGSGSGAGGAGSGIGATDVGQWVPTDSFFDSDLDTLYKLGEYINTTLTKALQGINWDSIYEGAEKAGQGFASFLNGLNDNSTLFNEIGKAIANTINTIGHALDGFGTEFHWDSLGTDIAEFFNGFNDNIDWELAYKNAKTYAKGIGTAINSFVDDLDVEAMATTFSNTINTLTTFAKDLGTTIDFKAIGDKLSTGLNKFFTELDAKQLAETIKVWITGAFTTVTTLLKKTDFELIGNKIGEFLAVLDLTSYLDDIADLIWTAIKDGFKLVKGIFEEAPLETALITAFGVLKFTKLGSLVSSSIVKAIAEKLSLDIASDATFIGLGKAIGGKIAGAITIDGVGVSIATLLTTDIAAVIAEGSIAAIGITIGTALVGGILSAIVGFDIGKKIGKALFPEDAETYDNFTWFEDGGFFDSLGYFCTDMLPKYAKNVKDFFSDLKDYAQSDIAKWWDGVKDKTATLKLDIQQKTNVAIDKLKENWESFKDKTAILVAEAKEKTSGSLEKLKQAWNEIKDKNNILEFKAKVSTTLADLKKNFEGKTINFVGKITTGLSDLISKFSGKKISFTGSISTSLSDLISKFEGKKISFTGGISTKFADLISKFKGKNISFTASISTKLKDLVSKFTGGTISFKANITSFVGNVGDKLKSALGFKAGGGLYKNGQWHSITQYATGGLPSAGELFIARERGPELVGRMGGGTAVMNNNQIVASVSKGVYDASYAAFSNVMARYANQGTQVNVVLEGDADKLFRQVRNSANDYTRRTGRPAFQY